MTSRAAEAGFILPGLPAGPLDAITDVPGVLVGQVSLHDDAHQPPIHTGVTVILPHGGDLFNEKAPAAVHTINGYGKAAGFEQVREMGTLETPIALTGTLCVGRVWDALVTWMLARNPEIGTTGPSVNPVVGECNDSRLNDLRGRHVHEEHVLQALAAARGGPVEEGSVGAGSGMVCYGLKGGVGTASRRVGGHALEGLPSTLEGSRLVEGSRSTLEGHTLGALVVANFGRLDQLTIRGLPVGKMLAEQESGPEHGSIMMVLATDAPLTDRQLGRLARRAALGLARTGSTVGNGSGDFVIAFSTAQRIAARPKGKVLRIAFLPEQALDGFFQAVVETIEESVLNALCQARPVGGGVPALPVEWVSERIKETGAGLKLPR